MQLIVEHELVIYCTDYAIILLENIARCLEYFNIDSFEKNLGSIYLHFLEAVESVKYHNVEQVQLDDGRLGYGRDFLPLTFLYFDMSNMQK